jgi:CHAD domain-containing protein
LWPHGSIAGGRRNQTAFLPARSTRPMGSLRVGRRSYERRHRNSVRALQELVRGLPDRPSPDQVHDLRVAVRRIQATRRLLPKDLREYPDSKRFDLALKSTIRATSQLRDLDTLIETLGTQTVPAETRISLQNQRSDLAATVRGATVSLAESPSPRLPSTQIRGRRISKRLRNRIRRQGRIAAALVQEVVSDESKVAELHSLRKEVKKLRYLLELADKGSPEAALLTEWQESLGAIHDLDVAIVYLQAKGPEYTKTVRNMQRIRHTRYLEFVNKRVLGSTSALTKSKILGAKPESPPHPI